MNENEQVEFAFDTREYHRLVLFLAGVFCASGLLVRFIGGHPWPYTLKCAVGLPLLCILIFGLLGLLGYRRSYLITSQGITLRRYGRDIGHVPWSEISGIQPRPLTIVTRSGRRIEPYLMRAELDRAREVLLDAFKAHGRNP